MIVIFSFLELRFLNISTLIKVEMLYFVTFVRPLPVMLGLMLIEISEKISRPKAIS